MHYGVSRVRWEICVTVKVAQSDESITLLKELDAMAESVERGLPAWQDGSLSPNRVKLTTDQIGTCHYLTWRSALLEYSRV